VQFTLPYHGWWYWARTFPFPRDSIEGLANSVGNRSVVSGAEPLVNKHFETIDDLDAVVALRCRDLNFDRTLIAQHTGFHWWPKSAAPN
jgi:hypothetical protein